MYLLAEMVPAVRRIRVPVSRDKAMMLLLAVMQIGMGIEAFTGHEMSGTIVPNEWIPIIYGPLAGLILVVAGLIARRHATTGQLVAAGVFVTSIAVGLLGAFFHLRRATAWAAPPGQRFSLDLLIWAPPVIAPLMFALIGVLGLSSVWAEEPAGSGLLWLWGKHRLQLPLSKTRAFFLWVGLAMLATVVSSVLDHARASFQNPWLWVPTMVGIFGTAVTIALGAIHVPRRNDLFVYAGALALMIAIGPVGAWLHIQNDLTAGGVVVVERLLRGAPVMAPLLFSNMGLLGAIVLLDPREPGMAGAENAARGTAVVGD
jgi:hypothetical protein